MMVVGIQGRFDLGQVLSLARQNQKDLVVMGNRSPVFKDTNLLLQEAARFHHDPGLVLIFEKHPNAQDPLCLDPLIIVRRSFLLEVATCIQAATLGAFAILLRMEASSSDETRDHTGAHPEVVGYWRDWIGRRGPARARTDTRPARRARDGSMLFGGRYKRPLSS